MATLLETDPVDAKLDEDGDVYIGENGVEFVSGLDGVAQLVGIALRLFKEEWVFNTAVGMPWHQEILGEKFDDALVRARAIEQIADVPGLLAVKAITVDFDAATRDLGISIDISTLFGDTTVEV